MRHSQVQMKTPRTAQLPLFFTQGIGSLPRPQVVRDLHCCHSVYKRQSDVTGDYQPILPRLREAKVDRVNLEFAYPGTGNVSDLKLLPDHLDVGMGVIDVRSERIQPLEEIEALGAAAV